MAKTAPPLGRFSRATSRSVDPVARSITSGGPANNLLLPFKQAPKVLLGQRRDGRNREILCHVRDAAHPDKRGRDARSGSRKLQGPLRTRGEAGEITFHLFRQISG